MAKHTTERRRRKTSDKEFWSERIGREITELRVFIADRAKNRGEAAMLLGAILAEVLHIGVEPERREELLGQIVEMIRKLWKRDDEAMTKDTPVM